MKFTRRFLLILLLIPALGLPLFYVDYETKNRAYSEKFLFGVSFGLNSTSEAKLLIDKVKGYTNLFVINSWDISINETALNEVCDYAADAELNFMVFFDYFSTFIYRWHCTWLENARGRWGDKFLGIYLYDEPGGRQIDEGQWDRGIFTKWVFENASDYSDAANLFVTDVRFSLSMLVAKNLNIPVFTSDYALYWFDYLAGYDAIFAQLGWNHSRAQQIALCRGAANVQGKEWGAIITWTYREPPYMENGPELLQDMITAYQAGAQYVIVFNYPKINPYGILTEEHFTAMQTFWNETHSSPRSLNGEARAEAAFVLPKDYGWGMRNLDDKIWLWPSDGLSPQIWSNMNKLIEKYCLKLDIIYDDPRFNFEGKYSETYFWNSTIN